MFSRYFEDNSWDDAESRSGPGSNLAGTEMVRRSLPGLLRKYGVRTFLDAPCGDLYWMREIVEAADLRYIGADIVPALIAGNAVVFKPSEKTPATGAMLVECFHEAGVPDGVIRLLIGAVSEGKALAAEPGIDGLLFTGSAGAGAALARQFAEMPHKILALELGGNNPIVAWDVSDIKAAATIIVQSAYLSAGQRCTAARRLIVEDGKHEELVAELHLVDVDLEPAVPPPAQADVAHRRGPAVELLERPSHVCPLSSSPRRRDDRTGAGRCGFPTGLVGIAP